MAHNRYWSDATPYARQNGGRYAFVVEPENHKAIPTSQAFWDDLMAASAAWGLGVYEQARPLPAKLPATGRFSACPNAPAGVALAPHPGAPACKHTPSSARPPGRTLRRRTGCMTSGRGSARR